MNSPPPRQLALALGLSIAGLCACGDAAEVQRPQCGQGTNVVIFLIDTLRADRLGTYGYARGTSPNLDALAKESIVFERAHAPAPWTLPSVASLMTGSLLPQHGVIRDGDRIPSGSTTLAEHLKRAGYSTGSFIHNPYAGPMTDLDRGFDVCEQADKSVGKAEVKRWLNAGPSHPFFLYLHNTVPHDPYRPKKQFLAHFGEVNSDVVDQIHELQDDYRQLTRENYAPWKEAQGLDNSGEQSAMLQRISVYKREIDDLYDAEILQVDHELGEVIETLKLRGEWEITLFIVLADHGEELGERGGWEHDQSLYNELVHVPFLIKQPGSEQGGRRVSASVSLIDVLPTLLDYLGQAPALDALSGSSLLPAMRGEDLGPGPRVTSYRFNKKKRYTPYRQQRGIENMVICEGDWKAIWNVDLGSLELYNISSDPSESTNLCAQEAQLCARLLAFGEEQRTLLMAAGELLRDANPSVTPLSAQERARLKDLGYLGDDE